MGRTLTAFERACERALVRVEPSGAVFEAGPDETVFEAAARAGYRWPTVCGGLGTCRTCVLVVTAGHGRCGPVGELEREGLDALGVPGDGTTRLACQLRVHGDVTVVKRGVRPVRPTTSIELPED